MFCLKEQQTKYEAAMSPPLVYRYLSSPFSQSQSLLDISCIAHPFPILYILHQQLAFTAAACWCMDITQKMRNASLRVLYKLYYGEIQSPSQRGVFQVAKMSHQKSDTYPCWGLRQESWLFIIHFCNLIKAFLRDSWLIHPNIDDQEKPIKVCDCNMLRKGEIHPPFVPSGCRV